MIDDEPFEDATDIRARQHLEDEEANAINARIEAGITASRSRAQNRAAHDHDTIAHLDFGYTPTCDALGRDCNMPAKYSMHYVCCSVVELSCHDHRVQIGQQLDDRSHPLIHTCKFAPVVRFHIIKVDS